MAAVNDVPVSSAVRQVRDLPTPPGSLIMGNARQIRPSTVHLQAEQWARELGEAYRFRIASRQFVVLSNPQTVASILRDRPDGFGRTQRFSETAAELAFGGLLTANGEQWKRQRPMVLSALDPSHIKAFFPTLVKVTERLKRRWERAAEAGQPVDVQGDLMRYTVDVTAGLAFGTEFNTIEADEEIIQEHLNKILPVFFKRLLAPVRHWRFVKLPDDREIERHVSALKGAVARFIAEAQERLRQEPSRVDQPANLIEAMLAARSREGDTITDEDVSQNVLTMLLAGEDTTANTLAWMIWLLGRHPEAAARATEEALSVLSGRSHAGHPDDLGRMDFIEACIHETMRLKPVVPLAGTEALRDTVVAGIHLPKGTIVWCLMRPGAVDDRHFEDAKSFRPERWLGGVSASSSKRVAMPFGAGPRMCPGRYLALAEMKMVASMLLAAFRLESVTTADGSEPKEQLALTMSPAGLEMQLARRP